MDCNREKYTFLWPNKKGTLPHLNLLVLRLQKGIHHTKNPGGLHVLLADNRSVVSGHPPKGVGRRIIQISALRAGLRPVALRNAPAGGRVTPLLPGTCPARHFHKALPYGNSKCKIFYICTIRGCKGGLSTRPSGSDNQ